MTETFKIGACQVPDVREDVDGALAWIERYAAEAQSQGIELLCFPECFLQGYLREGEQARRHALDLTSPAFAAVLERLARWKPALVFGLIEVQRGALFNTAVVVERGCLLGSYRKTHIHAGETLFQPGSSYPTFEVGRLRFGINICYDTQFAQAAAAVAAQGAQAMLCPCNNMLRRRVAEQWQDRHHQIRAERAKETRLWIISSDVTGERDDRVGLAPTSVIDPGGKQVARVPLRAVGMVVAEIAVYS